MKYQVAKSIDIKAPLEHVRGFVCDFSKWQEWSPWLIVEPSCSVDVTGPADQPGHTMSWDGEVVGSGIEKLIRSEEQLLTYDLEFLKPFKSKSKVRFQFKTNGNSTSVDWIMDAKMPLFLFFLTNLFKSLIGMDFERGLKMLKAIAENGKVPAETSMIGYQEFAGIACVGIERTVHYDELSTSIPKDIETLEKDLLAKHSTSAKHYLCVYPKVSQVKQEYTYVAAVSAENLMDKLNSLKPPFISYEIPASKTFVVRHLGSYHFLGNAWAMGMLTLRAKKMKQKGAPFEIYGNSPKNTREEELDTQLYFPIR